MSGFSSLNLGVSALSAAQRALDVTGQNLSNANTDGYSRQRVQQSANSGPVVPAMYAKGVPGGDGVTINGIDRVRDGFLELRAQQEHSTSSSLDATQQTYSAVESTFGEPSPTGLSSQLASFWSSWDGLANDPGAGTPPRGLLLENARALTGTVRAQDDQLSQQWRATRQQVDTTIDQVNGMATQVAKLNAAIRSATLSGGSANELSDQRDALVLRLAEATGATASPGQDGVVDVMLAGGALVRGTSSQQLMSTGPDTFRRGGDPIGIGWAPGGQPAAVGGGKLQGLLGSLNAILPDTVKSLDAVAASLAQIVNTQQAQGLDTSGKPGAPLFTGTTAADLQVAMTDPNGVAAATGTPSDPPVPPPLNGGNATAMSGHAADPGGPDALFRDMMVRLGVQAQSVGTRVDTQNAVKNQVDSARASVSGVSMDEEMTNLVAYQHAYSAAAQYISVISSTMDTLINMTR